MSREKWISSFVYKPLLDRFMYKKIYGVAMRSTCDATLDNFPSVLCEVNDTRFPYET